jgi:hypothetical protein
MSVIANQHHAREQKNIRIVPGYGLDDRGSIPGGGGGFSL